MMHLNEVVTSSLKQRNSLRVPKKLKIEHTLTELSAVAPTKVVLDRHLAKSDIERIIKLWNGCRIEPTLCRFVFGTCKVRETGL